MACETGTGTTIAFTGDAELVSFAAAARISVINGLEEEVDVLEDDSLASTGYMEYCKGKLIRVSPLEIEYRFDPNTANAIAPIGAEGTLTITYPDGATLAGSGFINRRTGGNYENAERPVGSFEWQFDGKATPPAYATNP